MRDDARYIYRKREFILPGASVGSATPQRRDDSVLRNIFPASCLLVDGRMDPKSERRPMNKNKSVVDRGHGEKKKKARFITMCPLILRPGNVRQFGVSGRDQKKES